MRRSKGHYDEKEIINSKMKGTSVKKKTKKPKTKKQGIGERAIVGHNTN